MNMINFLKRNPNTRKIFGERELKIIEKQMLGVNLTQSERNRLSRDIRKKFMFIRDISNKDFDFELKKASAIKEIIYEAKKEILSGRFASKIKRIILFGSTVEKNTSLHSDIDIAVEFASISKPEATEFRIKTPVNEKVDLLVFNFLPDKIKREVEEKGKVIYGKKN
jgi:predicted nucleotidyltransferase